ncbi:MAG: hypothetical protein AUK44_05735 [Porphyromonadaceae bacterium CG2_30_38_12]|nr:MAG: hypothetical protein AUK44_05735 [Porphyromonadaceae bacterium CG2_30_38_12]
MQKGYQNRVFESKYLSLSHNTLKSNSIFIGKKVESQVNVSTCFVIELPIDGSFFTDKERVENEEKNNTDAEILLAHTDESDPMVAIFTS